MKVVLDTNVIISSFVSNGICKNLFEICLESFTIIISKYIMDELNSIFNKKFKMPADKIKEIIDFLNENCELKTYEKIEEQVCRDRDDDNILALAKDSSVSYIITGDKDLLVLEKYNSIPIITPRIFFNIMNNINEDVEK